MTKHLLALCLSFLFAVSASAFESKEIELAPESVFVPPGYDDTDINIEIGLEFSLPNACFEFSGDPKIDTTDLARGIVRVSQKAVYHPKLVCTEMEASNVLRTVNLGKECPKGNYEVRINGAQIAEPIVATLPIAESKTEKVDNFSYLNVGQYFITKRNLDDEHGSGAASENSEDQEKIQSYINLRGEYKHACVNVSKVEITPFVKEHIIQVLPIVEVHADGVCAKESTDAVVSEKLPKVPHGKYMIHIRSAHGVSRNILVEL